MAESESSRDQRMVSGVLYLAAAGALIVGSLLPWIEVLTLLGSLSATGMDRGDGVYTLIGGILVGGTGVSLLGRDPLRRGVLWVEVGIVTIGVIVFWNRVNSAIDEAARQGLVARYGVGLWVMGAGVVAMWAAASKATSPAA